MPRKSAAALAIWTPPEGMPKPPAPPKELTPSQARIWSDIVMSKPHDWFTGAARTLLVALVRHADTANVLAKVIDATGPDDRRYSKLLGMAGREAAAVAALASKLRLTPQNQYRADKVLPKLVATPPWGKHV
jgi:hypothetical protein